MEDIAANPVRSNILQSIRSSCDRCRFYKLKCSVPTELGSPSPIPTPVSVPCERCTRAKAPCNFGRRQRGRVNKKQPSLSTSSPTSPTSTTTVADPDPTGEAYTHSSFLSQSHLPTTPPTSVKTAEPVWEIPTQSNQPYLPMPPTIPYVPLFPQSWENFMAGVHGVSNNLPGQESGMSGWGCMQQDFNLNDAFVFDDDMLDPESGLTSPALPSRSTDAVMAINKANSTVPVHRLVELIAEMQQCRQILEHGPWQNDDANSLDDYPIGTVLHLSQQFRAIASSVLSRGCVVGTLTPRGCISATEAATGGATKLKNIDGECDTVTTLLVLAGYMSLEHIYSIVLDHFQTHLSSIPSNGNTNHISRVHSASSNPTLQLGELPCTSVAPVLDRIHTAVSMLLAALHGVEEKLGPGGAVARNLVVVLLAQEGVLGAGKFNVGLSRKMRSVKELLQEKTTF